MAHSGQTLRVILVPLVIVLCSPNKIHYYSAFSFSTVAGRATACFLPRTRRQLVFVAGGSSRSFHLLRIAVSVKILAFRYPGASQPGRCVESGTTRRWGAAP